MMGQGYIQVYTGNGKGKTTAAIGLAIRALGAGKRVLFLQFMKAKTYSEHKVLEQLSPALMVEAVGKPYFIAKEGTIPAAELAKWQDEVVVFPPGKPPEEYRKIIAQGVTRAITAVQSGEYELVVLDEIIVALHFDLITWDQLQAILDSKAEAVELVLTGRGATAELLDRADLVTEMVEVKHYYRQGVQARLGIEN